MLVRAGGQEEKETTEDEMAGWHHRLDGHEFGWTPGVCDGHGGLACCNSWGRKESDTTELLNWTELKVMLKILQAKFQQYVNWELPDVQPGFRVGRGTRDQIAYIHWTTEKAREFKKNNHFFFTNYFKDFDSVDHNKLWKILKEMGIPYHVICLLRNL